MAAGPASPRCVSILLIVAGAIWSSQIDQNDTGGKPVIAQQQVTAHGKSRQAPLTAKQKKDQQKAKQDLADDRDEVNGLASIDNNLATFFGAALLNAIAFALLAFPMRALYRATKSRHPNEASVIGFLAVYGPLALGIGTARSGLCAQAHLGRFRRSAVRDRRRRRRRGARPPEGHRLRALPGA